MIAFLHGKLAEATPTHVIVDVNGVGYAAFIPLSSYDKLPPKGGDVKLLTHHHVIPREGTHQLFGFATAEEREMFLLLISVSGIGPKLALNILSSTSISTLRGAIVSGDSKTLSALRGIGKKTAERLVVELKDKLGAATPFETKGPRDHAGRTETHRCRPRTGFARLQANGRPSSHSGRRRETLARRLALKNWCGRP